MDYSYVRWEEDILPKKILKPPNTLSPNLLRISDFVVSSRVGHRKNALLPIVVTLGDMVMEVRLLQE